MRLSHFILHAFYHIFLPFPQSLFPVHSFSFQLFFFCFLSIYWVLNSVIIFFILEVVFIFQICLFFFHTILFSSFIFLIVKHNLFQIVSPWQRVVGNVVLPSVVCWFLLMVADFLLWDTWWQRGQAGFVSVFLRLSCLVPCLLCSFFRGSSVPANRLV